MRQRLGASWRVKNLHQEDLDCAKPIIRPLVMTAKMQNAIRLVHLDERARAIGLQPGTSLADAKAAFPDLDVLEEDANADRLLLEAMADWCDRYTPLIAIDEALPGEFGLMLDITGCAHLFGGERELMKDLLVRLFHQGFAATGAIAPGPGTAWALAHCQNTKTDKTHSALQSIRTLEEIEPALAPLPLNALRIGPDLVQALARLGLRTIGQLYRQPRAPVARRFGRELLYRLDQAMGAVEEAISPRRPVAELMAERRFAEPLVHENDIERTIRRLAAHLCEAMEKKGVGARQLQLSLFRVDGKTFHMEVGTSRPERNAEVMTRLFKERLAALQEDYDAGYGFETLRLSVMASQLMTQKETSFLQDSGTGDADHLIDRLTARLGAEAIVKGVPENTHLPERAEREIPVGAWHAEKASHRVNGRLRGLVSQAEYPEYSVQDISKIPSPHSIVSNSIAVRPLRLFSVPETIEAIAEVPDGPPIRFRWRKILHKVTRVEGPERICDHWWSRQTPRQTRDYFRIEDDRGHRYWLFREGLYERETDRPKWFLHGLFA